MNPQPRHARITALRETVQGNPLLPLTAAVGFSVSFQTITDLARQLGLPGWPQLYPVGIDLGILAMVVESKKAIADGRSDIAPRAIAWALSLGTIYVNAHGASSGNPTARVMHVIMPCLWIAFLELSRWRQLRRERASREDRIPRLRWVLSPWRTMGMRKRMTLHNIASYAVASLREEARLAGRDLARATWGNEWRRKAPRLLVHHLSTGTLPVDVSAACVTGEGVAEAVEAWVMTAAEGRAKAVAKTRAAEAVASTPPPSADAPATPPVTPAKAARAAGRGSRAEQDQRRRAAEKIWRADPSVPRKDVIEQTGLSPKTADRVKKQLAAEGIEFPHRLEAA